MSNVLSYKNYNGTVEYSKEDGCLYGKVIGLKSLLSYEGDSVWELETDFQNVIVKSGTRTNILAQKDKKLYTGNKRTEQ